MEKELVEEWFTTEEPSVDALLTAYIGVLLSRYDKCVEEEEQGAEPEPLGSVYILEDNGTIGTRVSNRCGEKTLVVCMPDILNAKKMEYIFTEWAVDHETLVDVVRAYRPPQEPYGEYEAYVAQVTCEISHILMGATIIPKGSYMHDRLRKAKAVVTGYN